MTHAEVECWKELKGNKLWVKFLRQKPIFLYEEEKWFPRYVIPDFCSLEKKIIIEIDGSIHNRKDVYELDQEKEKLLKQKWFSILRFWNNEVTDDLESVLEKIRASFP